MSFVPFGQNLQLQSGVPLAKVASVFAEKLSMTKRLEGGAGGNLMQSVLQNGDLSAIMQNPMAALTQGIQGQLPGLVSQLQGMVGGGPQALVQALTGSTGLGNAMQVFQAAGDNLAGLTNGATGFFAMIGHANTVDMAGAALPVAAAMSAVTAPVTSGDFLGSVSAALPGVVSAVVSGAMTADAATAWVQAQIAEAGSIVAGSAAALAWGEQMHPLIATVATAAGALAVPPTFDASGNRQEGEATGFQGTLRTLVQPAAAQAMDAAVAAAIAHAPPVKVDVTAMTSLED